MKRSPFYCIIENLHQFIGFVIGPFIIVAALTGCLYAIASLIEKPSYRKVLFVNESPESQMKSFGDQMKASDLYIKGEDLRFVAFRPAPDRRSSTRVLYTSKNLRDSEYRTIFINPYDLKVIGDLSTYGTTGAMPIRMTIDLLHRDLLLNNWGRFYSEIAASWMWVGALTGLFLFFKRRKKFLKAHNRFQKNLNFHMGLGFFCLIGLVALSATGLTWSSLAGDKISIIRQQFNWNTPGVDRKLSEFNNSEAKKINEPEAYYHLFDEVSRTARANAITSDYIEIRPGRNQLEAWTVGEYQRSFPTKVDTLAISPYDLKIISEARFKDFSVMAKLTRWGIDIHMGTMFGALNQLVLIALTIGIALLVFTGMKSRYLLGFNKDKWTAEFTEYIESYFKLTKNQARLMALTLLIVSYVVPWILYTLAIKLLVEAFVYYKIKQAKKMIKE